MEGSWEGIAGCVVHVDVRGECINVHICDTLWCNEAMEWGEYPTLAIKKNYEQRK